MKHFCVAPWFNQDLRGESKINKDFFCCWTQPKLTTDFSRKNIQEKFINGERPDECQKCWDSEDNNIQSRRQMENIFLDFSLDLSISNIKKEVLAGNAKILTHQIKLSTECNGACVTCDSGSSTTWAKYDAMLGKQIPIRINHPTDVINTLIDFNTVKSIKLLGGEPLMSTASFYIFDQLIAHNNTDCFISIVTNGSVNISKKYKKILQKFSKLNICLSIDATEQEFEYLRFPLKWDKLLTNLEKYREICDDISVSYTVSNINVHSQKKTIDWFNSQNLKYIVNNVIEPAHFAPNVKEGHTEWKNFVAAIHEQDAVKGINIVDYIPDVWNRFKEKKK